MPIAVGAGKGRRAGLAQVREGKLFQPDGMRLPARGDRVVTGGPDQQVRLYLATADMYDRPFGVRRRPRRLGR